MLGFFIGDNLMKYYLHDTNARNDEKVTLLFIKYSYEGIGLFYAILEVLAAQEKPVKELVLMAQLNIGKKLIKHLYYMYEIELLSKQNDEVFNENILNFSEKYQIKKQKTREKVAEWRKNQQDNKDVTSYKDIRNDVKVKESKVKEDKESFIVFWDNFHTITKMLKSDKDAAFKKWKQLSKEEKQKALDNIKPYYLSLKDKKFCKKARTYLGDKNFNDEFKKVLVIDKNDKYRLPDKHPNQMTPEELEDYCKS